MRLREILTELGHIAFGRPPENPKSLTKVIRRSAKIVDEYLPYAEPVFLERACKKLSLEGGFLGYHKSGLIEYSEFRKKIEAENEITMAIRAVLDALSEYTLHQKNVQTVRIGTIYQLFYREFLSAQVKDLSRLLQNLCAQLDAVERYDSGGQKFTGFLPIFGGIVTVGEEIEVLTFFADLLPLI